MLALLGENGQVVRLSRQRPRLHRAPAPGKAHQPPDARAQDALGRQQRDGAHPPAARDPGRSLPPRHVRGRIRQRHGGADRARHAHREAAAWSGAFDHQLASKLTFRSRIRPADDSSVIGRVLRTGTSMVCNDLQTLGDVPGGARATAHGPGFRSVVAYPLLVDRTPVGALMLTSYDVGAVGDEESRMLRELVANLSFALQYLHKEDEIRFLSVLRSAHRSRQARPVLRPAGARARAAHRTARHARRGGARHRAAVDHQRFVRPSRGRPAAAAGRRSHSSATWIPPSCWPTSAAAPSA